MRTILALCVCVASNLAFADDEPRRLADYHFANESWDIRPVYEPETGLVAAIVAVAKPEAVIGDNLNVVMFIRDGNEWEAWSWANATRVRAVYSAKSILNISDDDDSKWEMDEPLPWLGEDPIRPPSPYMAGMLTDDPLFEPVMNSTNPAALVSMLADLGYPVATAGRPLGDGGEMECGGDDPDTTKLLSMASGVEWGMTQEVTDEFSSEFVTDEVLAFLSGCAPTTPSCSPSITWTLGPIIPKSPCSYAFIDLSLTAVLGGFSATCNYEARRPFIQTQSGAGVRSNCTTYRCNQIRIGWAAAPVSCTTFVPNSTSFACPPQPSCAGPASSNAACSAIAPTFWNPWGPPCP